jgi:hypothetical protein
MVHRWFPTVDALARDAIAVDRAGIECLHACAGYENRDSRKAENAISAAAFWLDVDCGESKPYQTAQHGLRATKEFLTQARLPRPVTVWSGSGLHLYFPLRTPLAKQDWLPGAIRLKQLCELHGFHADPVRTADIASLLRPPGTYNCKYNPPRMVEWDEREDDYDTDDFLKALNYNSNRPQAMSRPVLRSIAGGRTDRSLAPQQMTSHRRLLPMLPIAAPK